MQAVESCETVDEHTQLSILTIENGKNRGRVYVYDLPSSEGQIWVERLRAVEECSLVPQGRVENKGEKRLEGGRGWGMQNTFGSLSELESFSGQLRGMKMRGSKMESYL